MFAELLAFAFLAGGKKEAARSYVQTGNGLGDKRRILGEAPGPRDMWRPSEDETA